MLISFGSKIKIQGLNKYKIMNEEVILFETDFWKVILHPNQAYLGYSIVVLKSKSESMSDITKNEWMEFREVVKSLNRLLKRHLEQLCLIGLVY